MTGPSLRRFFRRDDAEQLERIAVALERIADWLGASRRYRQRGDFFDSLAISRERYGIEAGEMVQIEKIARAMLRGKRRA